MASPEATGPGGKGEWGGCREVVEALRRLAGSRVAVFLHQNPDGDSLGSSLALADALRRLGAQPTVVAEDSFPAVYRFLQGTEGIQQAGDLAGTAFEAAIMPDVASPERLGASLALAETIPLWINIDHHGTNPGFGHARWVDPGRSSVGEMVLEVLWGLGVPISLQAAEAIYTAIMTDTGSFRYESVTPRVLRYAAYLVEQGVNPAKVAQQVYESMSASSFRLLAAALNSVRLEAGGRVAWLAVTRDMLAAAGAQRSETEGLVNYARSIEGVEVALLFMEEPGDQIRISFRAKEWADVGRVAAGLGGGGHRRAAGATLPGPLDEAVRVALAAVMEHLNEAGPAAAGEV